MRETYNLEFKERLSNTFLKTVSAYANYGDGEIIFGITDSGETVGIDNLNNLAISIESKINDSITPHVDYRIEADEAQSTLTLKVYEGKHKPYFYQSRAYKRNDSATITVDTLELSRLVLEGEHLSYESLAASNQDLRFTSLERALCDRLGLEHASLDLMKTLGLYTQGDGYCIAAEIVADNNSMPGIDIAKFGTTINIIEKRKTLSNISILDAYEQSIEIFKDYYVYEEIQGFARVSRERIPELAFREALANAIIHRVWDVSVPIRISMFDDAIEIVSYGGLPYGITEEEFLSGRFSTLRNPILADVFFRLGHVEKFGTGILRIRSLYESSYAKPEFTITANSITIKLPVLKDSIVLSRDEELVCGLLSRSSAKSISDICDGVPFGRTKLTQILSKLESDGVVVRTGVKRGTKYTLV